MDGSMVRRSVASEGEGDAGVRVAIWMRGLSDIENDVVCVYEGERVLEEGLDGKGKWGRGKGKEENEKIYIKKRVD